MPAVIPPLPYDPGESGHYGPYWREEDPKPSNYQTKTCKLRIRYYANGATGTPPEESLITYSGERKEVTLQRLVKGLGTDQLVKSGQVFIGWSTNSNAQVPEYDPGTIISKTWDVNESGTTTYDLYAIWTSAGRFTYKPGRYAIEAKYAWHDKYSSKASNLRGAIFTRTGYSQTGWLERDDNGSILIGDLRYNRYDLNSAYTGSGTTEVVLYPEWTANVYTITYKVNGGVGSDYSVLVTYDTEVTIPNESVFNYVGHHIVEWNELSDGSSSSWIPGETYSYTRAEDITLYAIWKGNEYIVTYDNDPNNYSIAVYGSPFYTDYRPDPPENRCFAGWKKPDNSLLVKQDAWMDAYSLGSDPVWNLLTGINLTHVWSDDYPFGKIFYGRKESTEYGIVVEEPPRYYWPERAYNHTKVNGKNGDVITDLRYFGNAKKEYKIAVYTGLGFYNAASAVSEFLHRYEGHGNYIRLEDTYEPDVYMLGIYEESGELENILQEAGRGTIIFNCKPQKFLRLGDRRIDINSTPTQITNPTSYPAAPILKIRGTGTIRFKGYPDYIYSKESGFLRTTEIEITRNYNEIAIDCETSEATELVGNSMNDYVSFYNPIRLYPGPNEISYEGSIRSISVIPRWWKQ